MTKRGFRMTLTLLSGSLLLGVSALMGCGGGSSSSAGVPNGKATRAQVLRGRYLVTSMGCTDCHSGGADPSSAKWMAGYQAGATNSVFTLGPNTVYTANITPDAATGIGTWTSRDIFNALRNGKDKEGKFLAPVMPWTSFRNLTDDDIYSIAAYLQNLRAVTNAVPANTGPGGTEPDWTHAYDALTPLPSYPTASENNVP